MSGKYEIWLTDDQGVRIAPLNNFVSLSAGRAVNAIGKFSMQLPASFDDSLLSAPDRMVQVWRQPTGGRQGLWRVYFVRRWRFEMRGANEVVTISGPDTNDLLRRRIVAAYAGSAQTSKTDYADDMMKEVVTEALADGVAPVPAAGTRVWANLSIAADLSDGPTITDSFAWDSSEPKLLNLSGGGTLGNLAKAARTAGTEVFLDVVPNVVSSNSITFQFVTYTGQPGQDVTSRVVFSQEKGNLKEPYYEESHEEEENYIYSGGQGEEATRNIQQVYDAARYGQSIWNRCEGFADARNQSTDNGVIRAGQTRLEDGRPRIRAGGIPMDTTGTRFGRDWDFGSKVRWRYRNREFDCIIRAVVISKDGGENGKEEIQTRLDYEGAV